MKTEQTIHREVDLAQYESNRHKYPPERLMAYAGQSIAFNWNGTELVASAPSDAELLDRLAEMGVPRECVVFGYVDEF